MQQGMHGQEFGQSRNDLARAVNHGDRETDGATERIKPARGVFGILDLGQNFAGAIEEQRAGFRQRDAARGAQQQRDAKPGLEFIDDARHRWLRQAEFACRM